MIVCWENKLMNVSRKDAKMRRHKDVEMQSYVTIYTFIFLVFFPVEIP